jgi:hypothetical protein
MVRPLLFPAAMKWLLLLITLASGCYSLGDTLTCLNYNDKWKYESCKAEEAHKRDRERKLGGEGEHRAQLDRDAELRAREVYRAALGPCQAGHAPACFATALYEDRHGAPSSKVEPRYRFACVAGVGRACFMAGTHARSRIDTNASGRGLDTPSARELAIASFAHGCELRDGDSCRAGLELEPDRLELLEDACAAHHREACTRLGR